MITAKELKKLFKMQSQKLHQLFYSKANYSQNDVLIKQAFINPDLSVVGKFEASIDYFWQAQKHYKTTSGTLAYYPGYGSIYGARNDGIEGISRLLPLWAAYLSSPAKNSSLKNEMRQHLKCAFVNGTNPQGAHYWGEISDKSTLICEAADIALALWLCRDNVWQEFSPAEKKLIISWLKQVNGKQTADNNWHLFVVLIEIVVLFFDPEFKSDIKTRYTKVKSFYADDGCFKDGINGDVDLYNAWAFQYGLYWIKTIDPTFDSHFISKMILQFSDWFKYLFTENGVPLFGRSLCYRMAMPVPLLAACSIDEQVISKQVALSSLYHCWSYFINHDALQNGCPTQGVFGRNIKWLDPYSGPASAFWSTRSLVLFYHQFTETNWHQVKLTKLPAHQENVVLEVKGAGICVLTDAKVGVSKVIFKDFTKDIDDIIFPPRKLKDSVREKVYGVASRPAHNLLKAEVKEFTSTLDYYRD